MKASHSLRLITIPPLLRVLTCRGLRLGLFRVHLASLWPCVRSFWSLSWRIAKVSKGHLSSELLTGMSYVYEHWSNSRYMAPVSTINHRFSFQTLPTFYDTSHGWGGEMLSLPPNPCSLLKLLSWVLTCFEYPSGASRRFLMRIVETWEWKKKSFSNISP